MGFVNARRNLETFQMGRTRDGAVMYAMSHFIPAMGGLPSTVPADKLGELGVLQLILRTVVVLL